MRSQRGDNLHNGIIMASLTPASVPEPDSPRLSRLRSIDIGSDFISNSGKALLCRTYLEDFRSLFLSIAVEI